MNKAQLRSRPFPHKMCSSKRICAVLKKKVCGSKAYCSVTQGCKKENSSKNGRFWYEIIGKTQPEMEVLDKVAFIYPFLLKAGSSIPSAARN